MEDIKKKDGQYSYDLTGTHLLLKTENARRVVPMMDIIVPYFEEYKASLPEGTTKSDDLVFASCNFTQNEQGKFSTSASKKLMRYVYKCYEANEPNLTIHSLRNIFTTFYI